MMPEQPENSIGGQQNGPDRRQYDLSRIGLEGMRSQEVLSRSDNPYALKLAVRAQLGVVEAQLVEIGQEPDKWKMSIMLQKLADREAESRAKLRLLKMCTSTDADELRNATEAMAAFGWDIPTDESMVKLVGDGQNQVRTLKKLNDEAISRTDLVKAASEQQMMSGDVEDYAVKFFFSNGRTIPNAYSYGYIGNLDSIGIPTYEREGGKEQMSLGRKIDVALRTIVDIAERKTGFDDVPNMFAMNAYRDVLISTLDKVTETVIIQSGGKLPELDERESSTVWSEAREAANLALILAKHLDIDVKLCITPKDSKGLETLLLQMDANTNNWGLELNATSKDSGKAVYMILRLMAEAGRKYPAAVGLPGLVGKFPNIAVDAMSVLSVSRIVEQKKVIDDVETINKITQSSTLWKLWRDGEVPFGDLPWDMSVWKDGGKYFDKMFGKTEGEIAKDITGINSDAFKIPYLLSMMYAVKDIYAVITGDPIKLYSDTLTNVTSLRKLNKSWATVFNMIGSAEGLSSSTITKLMQLEKVNLLGCGLSVWMTRDAGADANVGASIDQALKTGLRLKGRKDVLTVPMVGNRDQMIVPANESKYIDGMFRLARGQAAFLTPDYLQDVSAGETKEQAAERLNIAAHENVLLREVIKRKTGLLPGDCGDFFTTDEITQLKNSRFFAPLGIVSSKN